VKISRRQNGRPTANMIRNPFIFATPKIRAQLWERGTFLQSGTASRSARSRIGGLTSQSLTASTFRPRISGNSSQRATWSGRPRLGSISTSTSGDHVKSPAPPNLGFSGPWYSFFRRSFRKSQTHRLSKLSFSRSSTSIKAIRVSSGEILGDKTLLLEPPTGAKHGA